VAAFLHGTPECDVHGAVEVVFDRCGVVGNDLKEDVGVVLDHWVLSFSVKGRGV
jgi:hypothetical protein